MARSSKGELSLSRIQRSASWYEIHRARARALRPLWVPEDDRAFATRLARYCARNPVAPERLTYDRAAKVATYCSDKSEGPTAGTETGDPLEFLARVLVHIPDTGHGTPWRVLQPVVLFRAQNLAILISHFSTMDLSMLQRAGFGPIVALLVAGASLNAQVARPAVVLPDTLSCTACRIVLSPSVRLGADDGDGLFDREPANALSDTKGNIYVTVRPGGSVAYLFAPNGNFLRRIGRNGRGPGEFQEATALVAGRADSMSILDIRELRRTILAPGGRYVRSYHMPVISGEAVEMPDGLTIMKSTHGTGDQVGNPFHTVDQNGRYLHSFGGDSSTVVLVDGATVIHLTKSRASSFWAFPELSYTLSRWTANGEKQATLVRTPSWFDGKAKYESGVSGSKPTTSFTALHETPDELVWAVFRVASANWRQWLGTPEMIRGVPQYRKISTDKFYDSIIEVIDPKKGVVLQSAVIPGYVKCFVNDTTLAVYQEGEDAIPRFQLMRFKLTRPQTKR